MFVLDEGTLIQRLPWLKGATFEAICESYVDYISKRYDNAVVVFDGYPDGPSTKGITHLRRSKGMIGPEVCFSDNMPCKSKKEIFLSNTGNKQRFIQLISRKLSTNGVKIVQAVADADVYYLF